MRILSKETHLRFMERRRLAFVLSIVLIIVSVGSLATRWLNLGIEFTGGVEIELGYPAAADIERLRGVLVDAGFPEAQVQNFGSARDVIVRMPPADGVGPNELRDSLLSALRADTPQIDLRRADSVGPQIGEELAEDGGLAMIFVLLMIFAYIMFRFQWKFSTGAVAALIHDVILTIGFFSLFQLPFDQSVIAAVLAVIGYSLNDTVVVFDRIRENFLGMRGETSASVIDISINQMLARTIITGVTTLIVLFALLFLGGESVRGFSLALIVGIIVGTYSSIYTASAIALEFGVSAQDLMPPEQDPDGLDELP
jgi:preprotein translocase subunit SecF